MQCDVFNPKEVLSIFQARRQVDGHGRGALERPGQSRGRDVRAGMHDLHPDGTTAIEAGNIGAIRSLGNVDVEGAGVRDARAGVEVDGGAGFDVKSADAGGVHGGLVALALMFRSSA